MNVEGKFLEISVLDDFDSAEINRDSLRKKISKARRDRIETIVIGDGIKSLNECAFSSFENLQDFYVGSDVEYINPCCLADDYNPSTIEVDSKNKNFKSINSVIYSYDLKELILYAGKKKDRFFEVPQFVRVIKSRSFAGAFRLRSIKLNATVQKIEDQAFAFCGVCKIYFDQSIDNIGEDLFLVDGGWDDPRVYYCCYDLKCGGKAGSPIERYCAEKSLKFEAVEDDKIYKFLLTSEYASGVEIPF